MFEFAIGFICGALIMFGGLFYLASTPISEDDKDDFDDQYHNSFK